jgi:hypothetical protein
MLDILRDSAWQGIAGIIGGIALLLYVYVERDKLFGGLNHQARFALNFSIAIAAIFTVAAISVLILISILIYGANVITFTLIESLDNPTGILLASSLLAAGLASYFSIILFIISRDFIKNLAVYILVIFAGITLTGIIIGITNINSSETPTQVARIIFEWGRGVFTGVNAIVLALLLDKVFT